MHVSVINELTESNNNVHTIRTRGPVRSVNDALLPVDSITTDLRVCAASTHVGKRPFRERSVTQWFKYTQLLD